MNNVRLDIPDGRPSDARTSWFRWTPHERRETIRFDIQKEVVASTPTNEQLRGWAGKPENRPPQSWFDENDDPFAG